MGRRRGCRFIKTCSSASTTKLACAVRDVRQPTMRRAYRLEPICKVLRSLPQPTMPIKRTNLRSDGSKHEGEACLAPGFEFIDATARSYLQAPSWQISNLAFPLGGPTHFR